MAAYFTLGALASVPAAYVPLLVLGALEMGIGIADILKPTRVRLYSSLFLLLLMASFMSPLWTEPLKQFLMGWF